ncbi:putative bifunctional diguanylate cyclase/phosphodiesterase [Marinimicrococcus flavescens]|uniref:EAL domain-containing protein n=1 Tax=Marinimicrococcus flavescens TaxID=3031815 RepID=A0AAP3UYK5_9PROT|nr:EAL domain-containing protein [Marinimicrococcus flavescens]
MSRPGREQPLVLVADDDQMIRFLTREVLEQAGFAVEEVDDGRPAVAAFARLRPDVVLLDVMMKEMHGFDACAAMRALPGGTNAPILMITGLEDVDSINRAYEAGATDFVTKPLNWTILAHRVRYMLRASRAVQEVEVQKLRLAEAQRLAHLGSWQWELESGRIDWSAEMFRLYGRGVGEGAPDRQSWLARVNPEDLEELDCACARVAAEGGDAAVDYRIRLPGGGERFLHEHIAALADEHGQAIGLRGTTQDVTERKLAEARIHYLAHHDGLTGLPNRGMFHEQLSQALARATRDGMMLAVLFLDLDRFKEVNDGLGHAVGDLLLQAVAERLQGSVREVDAVARLGGDEFALVQTSMGHPAAAETLARRLVEILAVPVEVGGHQVTVATSVGIALFPADGADAAQLLKSADLALYRAKADGRGTFRFFEEGMNRAVHARLQLEQELRRGIAQGEFVLHYQPQHDLATKEIRSYEALLRWQHPRHGLVGPDTFITVAEETGLIEPLGRWVMQQACRDAARWLPPLKVSVNLSPAQFRSGDIVAMVAEALEAADLEPDRLELEITESLLLNHTETTLSTLSRLKAMGVRIAMDDFGTGYSSLAYLWQFPFDKLKIDRSFIGNLNVDRNVDAIVAAIIGLGHSLGMTVTAEGVEVEEQAKFLESHACHEIQGFLYGTPAPYAGLLAGPRPDPKRGLDPHEARHEGAALRPEAGGDARLPVAASGRW